MVVSLTAIVNHSLLLLLVVIVLRHYKTLATFDAAPTFQYMSLFNNLMYPKMLPATYPMARNNHHHISLLTNLLFIMSHELFRIFHALAILWNNPVSIHLHIDRLLHFIRNDFSDESIARCGGSIARGGVNEGGKAWNGEGIAELFIGHFANVFLVIVDFLRGWEGWGGSVIRVVLVLLWLGVVRGGVDPLLLLLCGAAVALYWMGGSRGGNRVVMFGNDCFCQEP